VRRVTVVVADDHTLIREGLVSLLQSQDSVDVVGQARDGLEALERVKELDPDVALLDLKMPNLDGAAASERIVRESPRTAIVIVTVSDTDQDLSAALAAGARGYVLKNATLDELLRAIHGAAAGQLVLSSSVASKVLLQMGATSATSSPLPQDSATPLTDREMEILRLLGRGASNREIADAMVIAEATVRGHVHHVLDKLKLQNRLQAAAYAARMGIE
jgi:two-component system, NarL family, nitrate/nitrite response regulator NarL